MENNKPGHISEKELDNLLNKAFLNLDFESNFKNKEILNIVTKNAMDKKAFLNFFNAGRLNLLFFLFSALVFLASFYRYVDLLRSGDEKKANSANETKQTKLIPLAPAAGDISERKPSAENFKVITPGRITPPANPKLSITERKNKKILPLILPAKDSIDAFTNISKQKFEVKVVDTLANELPDTLGHFSQKSMAKPASKVIKPKSAKTIKPVTPQVKAKVGKRRNSRLFHKDGTFKLQGRKYGKSR